MARKTRAKRPTQFLDAGHMQEILQEMKSEKAAAPRLSKKQSKALNNNFLQVEKPVVTVSAKKIENQYEALAKEIATEAANNVCVDEVQFACDIYSRQGEWLASLPNQEMAAMYAAILNARLTVGAYVYVPGSRSWLGEAPEQAQELAKLVDMAKELGETYGCGQETVYVLLAQDDISVCPVGLFRDKAYMELYHEVQVIFCQKRFMAGCVAAAGYASTLGTSLAWEGFFLLQGRDGRYNLGIAAAGLPQECIEFLQLCQQKYPKALMAIRNYAKKWLAGHGEAEQAADKQVKELTAEFLRSCHINRAYQNFFQAIYKKLLAAAVNEQRIWSGSGESHDPLQRWFFVQYFTSDVKPLHTLGSMAPCYLRKEMSWQEAKGRLQEYYPASHTAEDFPQQAWGRMQYLVIQENNQKILAGFGYICHAAAFVGYLSRLGRRATIRKMPGQLSQNMELAKAWGIYDVADSMCMLLAVSLDEEEGKTISKLLKEQNGRAHAVQPLIYHADIQRAFVYKFFIRFRHALGLDVKMLFRPGCIDSSQDIWQEMEELLRSAANQGSLKKLARHYIHNAKEDVSTSSVLIMLNIMAYRRLYEACYNPRRQVADKLAGSADISCCHVVARGWQPGIYPDVREGTEARKGFYNRVTAFMLNRFFAERFFLTHKFAEEPGTVYYAVEDGSKLGVTDIRPAQGRIVMHSEHLGELLAWTKCCRLQKNALAGTPYLPPELPLYEGVMAKNMDKLLAMLAASAHEPTLSMPRYAERELPYCIRQQGENGRILALFRYREQAEAVCARLSKTMEGIEAGARADELPLSMLPVVGIYDVSDAMHYLLAACQDVAISAVTAAVLDEAKQRTHRIELLADRFVMDIAAFADVDYSEQVWHTPCFEPHVLYDGIRSYIAQYVQEGIAKPEIMLRRLYARNGIAVNKLADQVFAPSFLLCWGRYMYERHYQPLAAEKEKIGAEAMQATAVVRAGRKGLFVQKAQLRRIEKFPETMQQKFCSRWAGELWISLYDWPMGQNIRYYVISKDGKTLEMTSDDGLECYALYSDPSPVNALRYLCQLKDSDEDIGEQRRSYFYDSLRKKYKNMKKAKLKAAKLRKKQKNVLKAITKQGNESKTSPNEQIQHQAAVSCAESAAHVSCGQGEARKGAAKPVRTASLTGQQHELFRGIQFDKHIFRNTSQEYQQRFQKTIAVRLKKLENILKGNVRAAGNDFRLVAVGKRRRVYKHRVGSQRLSMVLKDGVITLLRLSSHDRQMVDIRQIQGSTVGYIYYDMEEFLRQVQGWQQRGSKQQNLGDYLSSPSHYVYDSAQKDIIEAGNKFVNISIVGNAGAGKSVVGIKWLDDVLNTQAGNCLYLTMSENLVYTLGYELRKSAAAAKASARVDIETTFAFLQKCFKKYYPQIPEKCLLNGAQSLECFRNFWQEEVDWRWFWNTMDENFAYQTEETTLLAVWRDIHGILKGAAVENIDLSHGYSGSEMLSEEEYIHKLRQMKKASVPGVLWIRTLYKVCMMYQKYLRRCNLYDDNDIARMLLGKDCRCEKKYQAVFLDECQDLTQLELLALFLLLEGTSNKRMASDRCQMVQPTYFHEGWMRTMVNEYDRSRGRTIEPQGEKPFYLHYNYRSSRSIIDFQNFIVQYFDDSGIMTLKQNELMEIKVPPLTIQGMKPIWICPSAANQRLLIEHLWQRLDAASLQTIFAFQHSKSRQDFASAKPMMDVITCKGMEYPSVLLYNVLTEVQFDSLLAWKYFYVGATRSNGCLLIYEKDAVPGTDIYQFLQDAADLEIVDKCESLQEDCPYINGNWLAYIYQGIKENMADNKIETAENALNFGQYELALDIYLRDGKEQEMIDYCRGKDFEQKKDYTQALLSYERLPAGWFSQGRTRKNSAESILRKPDAGGREFLGAYMLTAAAGENMLENAKEAWKYKYGNMAGFYEALYGAVGVYKTSREALGSWTDGILRQVASLEAVCREKMKKGWEE